VSIDLLTFSLIGLGTGVFFLLVFFVYESHREAAFGLRLAAVLRRQPPPLARKGRI
jgi:hypothetical protein